jgi:deazaflavin-dependent oxidoreductase (nitroreductase family)
MWRLFGKTAHYWPTWFYKFISNTHSKLIKANHTKLGTKIIGDSILLLETIGNKSGKLRKTPLTYVVHKEKYLIAASYSGNDKTPDWCFNLQHSNAYITVDSERFEVKSKFLEDNEKKYYWDLLDKHYPTFITYRNRTDRNIPLVLLSKV